MILPGAPLQVVVSYRWLDAGDGQPVVDLPAWDWWVSTRRDGKHSYIVVAEPYADCSEPDQEVLACGHTRDLVPFRGFKRYNRRRRCNLCAMQEGVTHDSL